MFYVAALENKKQVLSIKSQDSGLQTNKQTNKQTNITQYSKWFERGGKM